MGKSMKVYVLCCNIEMYCIDSLHLSINYTVINPLFIMASYLATQNVSPVSVSDEITELNLLIAGIVLTLYLI